jgi:hypothetical protein
MKATIKQAIRNERNLTVLKTGYGHWKIECDYRGKRISTTTTNSIAVDNWNSDHFERDQYGCNRIKTGYQDLCSEIIRKSNNL